MAKPLFLETFCVFFTISIALCTFGINVGCIKTGNRTVPALFVFGDSLVDVGNNNYLPLSLAKANFPHNGIDFPARKPTGRFSNGKNAADFLAEKMELRTPPPYLLPRTRRDTAFFLAGLNFASGGAGIFDTTNLNHVFGQSVSLSKQVDFYLSVHKDLLEDLPEPSRAQTYLSRSIFAVVIGSNDLFDYFRPLDLRNKIPIEIYVDSMVNALRAQLKRLYDAGARKFLIAGIGEIGCVPGQRVKNPQARCHEDANHWSHEYNKLLKLMLKKLKSELTDMAYSCFDSYSAMHHVLNNPAAYGFKETKAACCGLGELNAIVPCVPISSYCYNRTEYVFWDMYHPTQEASRIFVDILFHGNYSHPYNLKHLISI